MESNENFTVIKDTREQQGWFFPNMIERKLKTGDYTILGLEDKLAIERKKNTSEMCQNFLSDTFARCLDRLALFSSAYLICEFEESDFGIFPRHSGLPKSAMRKSRVSAAFLVKLYTKAREKHPNINWIFCRESLSAQMKAYEIMKEEYARYTR